MQIRKKHSDRFQIRDLTAPAVFSKHYSIKLSPFPFNSSLFGRAELLELTTSAKSGSMNKKFFIVESINCLIYEKILSITIETIF